MDTKEALKQSIKELQYNRECGYSPDITTIRIIESVLEAMPREVALSKPTDATNASAEARLREVLKKIEYASRKDSLTDCERIQSIRALVNAALSACGDEAKKSGGGKEPRGCPTPDRREIVAQIIDPSAFEPNNLAQEPFYIDLWKRRALAKADAILATLDGGRDA